jgi:hypothetical protein
MERFAACFVGLEDPREDNERHDLHEILIIALSAMLCGAEGCSDRRYAAGRRRGSCASSYGYAVAFPATTPSAVYSACSTSRSSTSASCASRKTSPRRHGTRSRSMERRCAAPSIGRHRNPRCTWWRVGARLSPAARPGGDPGEIESDHGRAEANGANASSASTSGIVWP